MSVRTLEIEGVSAEPGSVVRGGFDVAELSDGTKVRIPLVLINGMRPGPRLYLGAAIHGDEVNGVAILSNALATVEARSLAGQIVCIPVQHPLSFYADHRLPLAQFLKSPLDQAPADTWTCFPGDHAGNLAQQLAARLFHIIKQCDYGLDVHTPTRGARYVPIAILPHPELKDYGRVRELAQALDPGCIVESSGGMYVNDGILCVEATRAGVPCLTFEIGEGGRLEPDVVRTGAACIRNVMSWLNMSDDAHTAPKHRYVMRSFVGLRAKHGGLLYNEVALGAEVRRGDLLCRIVNIYGDDVQHVVTPDDGVFVRATTLSTVSTGERVATLGII